MRNPGGTYVNPAMLDAGSGADVSGRFLFSPAHELASSSAGAPAPPLIADSWLVSDGAVRGLELHEARFRESCTRLLPKLESQVLERFFCDVRHSLPREGRWFPRIEAQAGPKPQLALWLRAAPELAEMTRLWVPGEPDARRQPLVKGPDLPALALLREKASLAGADDALLSARDGTVLEAAHSAIVWWRGETLCVPEAQDAILPSVTRALLLGIAGREGIEVREERVSIADLQDLETWTLNALHGIRPVSAWLTAGLEHSPPVDPARAHELSRALDSLAVSIDEPTPAL